MEKLSGGKHQSMNNNNSNGSSLKDKEDINNEIMNAFE